MSLLDQLVSGFNTITFSHIPPVQFVIFVGMAMLFIDSLRSVIQRLYCLVHPHSYYRYDVHWVIVTILVTMYVSVSSMIKYSYDDIINDTCSTTIDTPVMSVFATVVAYLCYDMLTDEVSSEPLALHHIICIIPLVWCILFGYTVGVYLIELFMMSIIYVPLLCLILLSKHSYERSYVTLPIVLIMFVADILFWIVFFAKVISCAPSVYPTKSGTNLSYAVIFLSYIAYGIVNAGRFFLLNVRHT